MTSTRMPSSTSGTDSAAAAAWSNWNSVKISVVNVWKCTISNAPYSESTASTATRQPPSSAGCTCGSVTRTNVATRPTPRLADACSSAGSARRSAADTGR